MPGMWAGLFVIALRNLFYFGVPLWWIFFWLLPVPLYYRGGAARFSFSLVAFGVVLFLLVVCWGFALLVINS